MISGDGRVYLSFGANSAIAKLGRKLSCESRPFSLEKKKGYFIFDKGVGSKYRSRSIRSHRSPTCSV